MPDQQQGPSETAKPRLPTAATRAYREAGTQLQLDLGVDYSGDPDKDFAALLAVHRKATTALARIELRNGKDPAMRRLAEAVIASDAKETALLQTWQGKHN